MVNKLKIEVMQEGHGDVAEHGQRVIVHYEGRLTDGTVFDGSRPSGQPFSFNIGDGQVIQGWEQGLLGLCLGERAILLIPPELGYGARGAGDDIPGGATLRFDVEVMVGKRINFSSATTPLGFQKTVEAEVERKTGIICNNN